MKTYTNKSNAARAAKQANGGNLDGMVLKGTEGAWYYEKGTSAPAKKAPAKKAVKKAAKKVARKAASKPARAAVVEEYDVKHGPTQGRISGYHIDEERPVKHGVKKRSNGTIGGRLWAIFDTMAEKAGGPAKLEIAVVKESPKVAEFNKNKVLIEFYLWRKHNGVRGRGRKQKVAQ